MWWLRWDVCVVEVVEVGGVCGGGGWCMVEVVCVWRGWVCVWWLCWVC